MSPLQHSAGLFRRGQLCIAVLLLGACQRVRGGPRLEASWAGSDTGKIAARATAAWCPVAKRLEITAVQGDVGFGLVVYPVDQPDTGEYPAFDPGIDSVHRPGSAGAARLFTEQRIEGYQSDSGSVTVSRSERALSARFGFRMRSLEGADTIFAEGRAVGVIPGACRMDSVPNTAPTQ